MCRIHASCNLGSRYQYNPTRENVGKSKVICRLRPATNGKWPDLASGIAANKKTGPKPGLMDYWLLNSPSEARLH